jgi:hypothetical protein
VPRAAGPVLTIALSGVLAGAAPTDWSFTQDTPGEIRLPAAIVDAPEFGQLEYDGPPYRGLRVDLDGDGVPEYIVQSAPNLCGNGGCPYALFEGSRLRSLGMIFGGLLVVRAAPPGAFPVIHAYSHLSAVSATYTAFVYDGRRYVSRSSIEVSGLALEQLTEELRRVPRR